MNIQASYNWIKEFVDTAIDAQEFARLVSLCGPGVERLYPQAPLFDRMVVGRIAEVRAHPNPKVTKLRIVALDVGEAAPLELVCGGSNLEPGMLVAVALVGAKVRWHGEGDPITLAAAVIQGVESAGMVCGANEIGLGDAFPHAEREILDLTFTGAAPGTPLAAALSIDDTVMDIEVTTNRPDAFSMVGLAREAAAILDARFTWKEPSLPAAPKQPSVELAAENRAQGLCTRYQAVAVTIPGGIGESPWWLKDRLRMSGIRPINAVVDITNYVMLEFGQPMHAFDYAKLAGGKIIVREAADGEKLRLLDGTEAELSAGQLVIADAERPVAVAGVMGGEESGVSAATTTVVFEAATFDPVSVRRTARALNLHTESSLRFEKGLPEEQTTAALARAVELARELAGAEVAGSVVDERATTRQLRAVPFRPEKAAALIGADIPEARMVGILEALGFTVTGEPGARTVAVPYWRDRDIEGERDLVEEIARIHGYHNLPAILPVGELPASAPSPLLAVEDRARTLLKGAGYTECMTYSFVSRDMLTKAGLSSADALAVANPLSKDFEVMRTSLLPGLLAVVAENEGLFPHGECFEVGNAYLPRTGDLPEEVPLLTMFRYGQEDGDLQFRRAKGTLEACAAGEGLRALRYERLTDDARWHPGRAVRVFAGEHMLGTLGEVHPDIVAAFGIRGRVVAAELHLGTIAALNARGHAYQPIPPFPSVLRDLAFVVSERAEYAELDACIRSASELLTDAALFDVYHGTGLPEGKKSVAVHLAFTAPDRTLRSEEVDAEMQRIVAALADRLDATVRE